MLKLICGVRDIPAKAMIGVPLIFGHTAVATRFFGDLLTDPNAVPYKHPQDYELVQYAVYDEAQDVMEALITPRVLYTGVEFLQHTKEREA